MKAILEFELPEDQDGFDKAIKGADFYLTVLDLCQWLRNKIKYGHEFKDANEALMQTQTELYDILDTYNIRLD